MRALSGRGHDLILAQSSPGEREAGVPVTIELTGGSLKKKKTKALGGRFFVIDGERSRYGIARREFGATGVAVSEIGFGAWGIGGGYGGVDKTESLNALAAAEELGCNFVDTAMVYGNSEQVLGEFLKGRRSKWFVATKYSGQSPGMTATIEKQLETLQTDAVDLYQLHWYPRGADKQLLDELERLKQAGKARFIGISLSSPIDLQDALARPSIDAFQIPLSLLQPEPFLTCLAVLKRNRRGVVVRSALRKGFLTGKYGRNAAFTDPDDQRHKLTLAEVAGIVDQVERFRFLERDATSMASAAVRYPLSFSPVSTVILGTKTETQARSNFGEIPGTLSSVALEQIRVLQLKLGLRGAAWRRWATGIRLAMRRTN
jgi:aryl-alcohol dehydrogenase-like predicted oxidoreductase